jgi:hypothetical protein
MKTETTDHVERGAIPIAKPLTERAASGPEQTIGLKSCAELERIVITTQNTVYDIIVLAGETGEVMIRGGRCFPEFQRAIVAGSSFGGSALKLRTICVGLHLEFRIARKTFVTSRVQSVSRVIVRATGSQV